MKLRTTAIAVLAVAFLTISALVLFGGDREVDGGAADSSPVADTSTRIEGTETAVLAGGCFWGVEAVFERLNGVIDVRSGYSGGLAETATYAQVAYAKRTNHAESVEIVFDPEVIGYEVLLDVFFAVAHDPTQLNRQGPDVGRHYRSVIFFSNEEQRSVAESKIEALDQSRVYSRPIVTVLEPLDAFYVAEDYHQDYVKHNPRQTYVVYWDLPKIEHLEQAFPDLLK